MRRRDQEERAVFVIQNMDNLANFLRISGPKCIIFHDNFNFSASSGLKNSDFEISWGFVTQVSQVPIASLKFDRDDDKIKTYLPKFEEYKNKTPVMVLVVDGIEFWKPITNIFDILSYTLLKPMIKKSVVLRDTIIYIGASFCPPCRKIMQKIPELAEIFSQYDFLKIDFDNSPELVKDLGVDIIPTFCMIRAGNDQPLLKYQNSDFELVKEKISQWTFSIDDDF